MPAYVAGLADRIRKIGVTGFEPATSRPPAVRSSQAEPYPEYFSSIPQKKTKVNC